MNKTLIFSLGILSAAVASGADLVMRPNGGCGSLEAALKQVRALRAQGKIPASRCVEVRVESGVYRQQKPVVFTPEDSNIVFDGAEGAVFDGGVELPPFRAGADGIWRAKVPAGLKFEQLYVNDRRAQRARTPNKFYLYIASALEGDTDPRTGKRLERHEHRAFVGELKDVAPLAKLTPEELDEVDIQFWQSWDHGHSKVEYVDGKTGLVITKTGTSRPLYYWNATRPRYAIENYRGALDAPGEWFLDRKAGELLYIPRAGENPSTTKAVAPVASSLVRLAGDPAGKCVENVSFRGIEFRHTSWVLPNEGAVNQQSAQNIRNAVVFGDWLRGIKLERCSIRHAGTHGVWFKRGSRNCVVDHCRIEDLGGGGVYLGDTAGWQEEKPERRSGFNRVSDSIIRGGGLIFNGAIGVWLGHTSDNEISHNDIGDFRYTGVSMGWTWGYAETICKRNRLLWNRIHHIGQGVLSDMGGVYTLGDSRGTVEIGNWIHDVNGYAGAGSPAWGLYTDEGSRGILLASNLVERCRDGAVHQHYGRENTWSNNILATFDRIGVWRSRVEQHTTIIVKNNILWWTNPDAHLLSGNKGTTISDVVFDNNLYWGVNGVCKDAFSGRSVEEWRKAGHDQKSLFADPKFADPKKGDWRLQPSSPALKMGFVPWDWTDAGVLKRDAKWRALAMDDTTIPPLEDAPKAPRCARSTARTNFETMSTGWHQKYGPLNPAAPGGFAVVAEGYKSAHSLKLTDGPGHPWSWHPHLTSNVECEKGSVRVAFAFKAEKEARPWIECRDYSQPGVEYTPGPSIFIEDGVLRASGRELGRVAPGTWATVDIQLHLTGTKARTWDCTVTPEGGKPVVTKGIKQTSKFTVLQWVGFMSNGEPKASWWLDNYVVEPINH